jgi:hypothetical protein
VGAAVGMIRAARFVLALVALLCAAVGLARAQTVGFPPPSVVVYPLTGVGVSPDVGGNVAVLLATRLAQLGGVTVKPPTPGTDRRAFLTAAVAIGADYYVTGFLQPVGSDVSLIVQVVSTHSGSIVYSTTSTVRTYADAANEADVIHDAVLRHAGRAYAALDAPAPLPTDTPRPSGRAVNLSKALRGKRRAAGASSAATPTPAAKAASPSPAIAAAGSRVLVPDAAGDGDTATHAAAAAALADALRRRGIDAATLPTDAPGAVTHAREICAANAGTSALYAERLTVAFEDPKHPNVQLDVSAYDCTGAQLTATRAFGSDARGSLDAAIGRAAAAAASALAADLHRHA